MAVFAVVQFLAERLGPSLDLEPLRAELGLPAQEPIDPQQYVDRRIPLPRLHRVIVERLSDESLLDEYRRASMYQATRAVRVLAREIVARPTMASREEHLLAYASLVRMEERAKAVSLIAEARKAAESMGQSSAGWDLMELSLYLADRNPEGSMRLIEHISREHIREPDVAAALQHMLMEAGVLRPDGARPTAAQQAADVAAPSIVVPGQEAPEAGRIWTPDGTQPGQEKKIWTPGMD
jgi:hypothetical protein